MSSNTFFILLVIFNLLAIHYAYRIDPNGESSQAVSFRTYDENGNEQQGGRLANTYDTKSREEFHLDNHDLIPCYVSSSSSSSAYIICKKLDQLSRRDTGFLRFGRKR